MPRNSPLYINWTGACQGIKDGEILWPDVTPSLQPPAPPTYVLDFTPDILTVPDNVLQDHGSHATNKKPRRLSFSKLRSPGVPQLLFQTPLWKHQEKAAARAYTGLRPQPGGGLHSLFMECLVNSHISGHRADVRCGRLSSSSSAP